MSDYFVIGKIVNAQGIKGEVRAIPTTDDINRFKKLKEVYISKKNDLTLYNIESVRFHKQLVLLKFQEINTRDEAELLKNTELKIDKKDAIPCAENEYYINDLYNMKVVTDDGEELGVIEEILFTGANDVYIVKKGDNQILIPAIKQCILNVNINEKIMTVHLLEGLR